MADSEHTPHIISKEDARANGLRYYFTGIPCKWGHIARRQVLNAVCTACSAKAAREWEIRNPDRKDPLRKHKQSLWNAARYRRKSREIGEKGHIWYVKNQEHAKERQRLYYKQKRKDAPEVFKTYFHNRRARKNTGRHTAGDIREILKHQRGRCAYCKLKLGKSYHVDHIQPLSKGGNNYRSNLQILCRKCNLAKSSRDPIYHAQTLGLLL